MGSPQWFPAGFLLLHEVPGSNAGSVIRIYHKVFPFCARPGLPATTWDGRIFAFHGDVFRNQISMVNWEEGFYFALVEPVSVSTVENIDQAFCGDLPTELFGSYEAGDAGT